MLAARVRLRRVSDALDELLSVLRRRLDDSWFQNNMRKLRKEAMARVSDSHSYHDAVKAAAKKEMDAKSNRKKGILGGFRTARLWARKAVMREEAIERWDLVRRAVPTVVAEGAAWWDRDPPTPKRGRFQIDSAKAMQDVERGFGRVVADARAVAKAAARAAAERPARAAAGGAVALFAALVGARAKRRRGKLTLGTIGQEMATTGREMTKMAKAAQEELTHVIEDAGRAVDRAVHPHHPPRPPHEQHDAPKPHKPPARVRPPKRGADHAAAETAPGTESTHAGETTHARRRAPANETRREDSSSAATDARRLDARKPAKVPAAKTPSATTTTSDSSSSKTPSATTTTSDSSSEDTVGDDEDFRFVVEDTVGDDDDFRFVVVEDTVGDDDNFRFVVVEDTVGDDDNFRFVVVEDTVGDDEDFRFVVVEDTVGDDDFRFFFVAAGPFEAREVTPEVTSSANANAKTRATTLPYCFLATYSLHFIMVQCFRTRSTFRASSSRRDFSRAADIFRAEDFSPPPDFSSRLVWRPSPRRSP